MAFSYHGGKQRIGNELSKIIYDVSIDIEDEYQFDILGYLEPFVGAMGVYNHIPELFQETHPDINYLAGDTNESLIKMWNATKRGWTPPEKVNKKEYYKIKERKGSSALKGFVGHQYSFGGVFFSAYAPEYGKNKNAKINIDKLKKIGKKIKKYNINFTEGDYRQFSNIKGYVIYCDPPYNNTTKKYKDDFDHKEFWKWCRMMAKDNIVFMSEYSAPKDFELIYTKPRNISYRGDNINKQEKLYVIY